MPAQGLGKSSSVLNGHHATHFTAKFIFWEEKVILMIKKKTLPKYFNTLKDFLETVQVEGRTFAAGMN